jgi:hypothetical protein
MPMTGEAAIAALVELVPPPKRATRPDEIDWAEFERENGFAAPTDYRLLLERYGVGTFGTSATAALGGWLNLVDPFHPEQSLLDQSEWERRNDRGLQRQFPEQYPGWPMWPEPDGLLPWGRSIDGDLVGWWTTGVPDVWGTRFFGRGNDFAEFPFGIGEFIVRLYRGELDDPRLDSVFGPLEAENARLFFPLPVEARLPPQPPREYVSVRFVGLTSAIDPASAPSSAEIFQAKSDEKRRAAQDEYLRRFAAVTRPADEIFDSWKVAVERIGVRIDAWGARSLGGGDPLHHHLECSFEPALEAAAKSAVAELSQQLGVAIRDVHNLDYDRIWQDLSRPGLRLVR